LPGSNFERQGEQKMRQEEGRKSGFQVYLKLSWVKKKKKKKKKGLKNFLP